MSESKYQVEVHLIEVNEDLFVDGWEIVDSMIVGPILHASLSEVKDVFDTIEAAWAERTKHYE